MKIILLINVKTPTIVVVLTFISRVDTASKCLIARKMFFFSILVYMGSLMFMLS